MSRSQAPHRAWLALALILAALNLRPALASLGPVLPDVLRTTGTSLAAAGVATTAPVIALGLAALLAPGLAWRLGMERAILAMLALLAGGIALRSMLGFPGLLAGSLVAGAAIGVVGVLLPSLVKRDFPDRISAMTGLYTMCLCFGAAVAAGATVPLAGLLTGWRPALAFWAVPALLAAAVWAALLPRRAGGPARPAHRARGLWGDALAWQVTLFMGLQASLAYIVFGWLAPLLRDRGLDAATAGLVVSISVMAQLPTALTTPALAVRRRSQSLVVGLSMGVTLVGFLGCLHAPLGTIWLWAVALGLGQGACIAVAMLIIMLRAPDAATAAQLSGMSQSVGYVLASTGPLAAGLLHDWTGGWSAVSGLVIAIAAAAALFGLAAGRPRHVRALGTRSA